MFPLKDDIPTRRTPILTIALIAINVAVFFLQVTVVGDDKSFKSENISSGDDYTFAFKKAGTFKYGCKYHPREKGTITVEK